jgi:hypothetical protein
MHIGILFNLFFKLIVMLAKLRLPHPFHGYVKTFQWWLITAQLCAIELSNLPASASAGTR